MNIDDRHGASSPEPDEIARLLAAAGPRRDVGPEVAPLRDAVHAAWRAGLAGRSRRQAVVRRRLYALAAAIPLLLAAGWLAVRLTPRSVPEPTATVTMATVQ